MFRSFFPAFSLFLLFEIETATHSIMEIIGKNTLLASFCKSFTCFYSFHGFVKKKLREITTDMKAFPVEIIKWCEKIIHVKTHELLQSLRAACNFVIS